jgi:hypothetical protein
MLRVSSGWIFIQESSGLAKHKYCAVLLGLLFLICCQAKALATLDQAARLEIEYLLTRLEMSGCQFFRNGKWYDAKRARRHLEKKYTWLAKRDLVASAEQFIERAATESSRSGEPYLVQCADDPPVPSALWLINELGSHRSTGDRR